MHSHLLTASKRLANDSEAMESDGGFPVSGGTGFSMEADEVLVDTAVFLDNVVVQVPLALDDFRGFLGIAS